MGLLLVIKAVVAASFAATKRAAAGAAAAPVGAAVCQRCISATYAGSYVGVPKGGPFK